MSKRADARVVLISEEMECEEFDYLRWFPEGADEFKPKVDVTVEIEPLTVRQFHNEWIETAICPVESATGLSGELQKEHSAVHGRQGVEQPHCGHAGSLP